MTILEEIINAVRLHALSCEVPNFSMRNDLASLHKKVRCSCGYEREIPFSAALESAEGFGNLENTLNAFNSPTFLRLRKENIERRKEEESIRRNLEKRRSAIGSLEV